MFPRFRGLVGALLLSALAPCAASAGEVHAAFGARPAVRQASLSPNGALVALVQPLAEPQAYALFVGRLDGQGELKPILLSSGRPDRLRACNWVSDTRLLCSILMWLDKDGRRIAYTRMVAVDADGGRVRELTAMARGTAVGYRQDGGEVVDWLANDPGGAVLMTRDFVPEVGVGTRLANEREGLGVERVDTATLKRTLIEKPRADAAGYISDQHGAVRILVQQDRSHDGYIRGGRRFFYRLDGGGEWLPLSVGDKDDFEPVAIDRDLNAAYGFASHQGRQALFRVALDGSLKRELLVARADVDVTELVTIGRQNRVVGAGYVTDRRQTEFFDAPLKALSVALSKALPGRPMVTFVDASQDENRLLVWAGSDVDPGRYYLYDRKTRALSEVAAERPELSALPLAPVKAMVYQAADGARVPAYLTLPPGREARNLPALVMPHGGPGSRDEWGFDWLAQYFAHRGYVVLQPNFRGSTGYGEAWFQQNGFRSWRTAVGDVNDAGRWLRAEGVAAPDKLAIVGWSYGGYAALQSSVLDPDLFKAIVAVAPVTDLEALREESRGFVSYKMVDAFIGRGPHVEEGSPARNAGRIKAPVLLFHGDQDNNVGVGESRLMLSRLKAAGAKAELVVYPGLDHQLDDAKTRAAMLEAADTFLREALGL